MKRKILAFVIAVLLIGICAWSPWLTQTRALERAETQFNHAWNSVADGCGTYGTDLGARDFRKVLFGAYVTLDYQCGLVMPGEAPLHTNVYVSFLGIAFGYPKP